MGGTDGDLGKRVAGADEATLRSAGIHVAAVDLHFGPQGLKALEEEVYWPCADGAAAGQRHARLALAGEKRADDPEARAHLRHEFIGCRQVGDGAAGEVNGTGVGTVLVLAAAIDGYVDAMIAEDADELLDIGEMRHVFQRKRVAGHQRGDHKRQRCVLGPGNRNGADERLAAHNPDTIHKYVPKGTLGAGAGKVPPP
jgi:hypothetical protein